MIQITVSLFSVLIDIINEEEIELTLEENSTIKDILDEITNKYGNKFKEFILIPPDRINNYIIIAKNGIDIRSLKLLETDLKEGDNISFLPAIAGG